MLWFPLQHHRLRDTYLPMFTNSKCVSIIVESFKALMDGWTDSSDKIELISKNDENQKLYNLNLHQGWPTFLISVPKSA
jgi:hypothetical protein